MRRHGAAAAGGVCPSVGEAALCAFDAKVRAGTQPRPRKGQWRPDQPHWRAQVGWQCHYVRATELDGEGGAANENTGNGKAKPAGRLWDLVWEGGAKARRGHSQGNAVERDGHQRALQRRYWAEIRGSATTALTAEAANRSMMRAPLLCTTSHAWQSLDFPADRSTQFSN